MKQPQHGLKSLLLSRSLSEILPPHPPHQKKKKKDLPVSSIAPFAPLPFFWAPSWVITALEFSKKPLKYQQAFQQASNYPGFNDNFPAQKGDSNTDDYTPLPPWFKFSTFEEVSCFHFECFPPLRPYVH